MSVKQYSDSELDKLIKETVHEIMDSAVPPPMEESWARFEQKLKEQRTLSIKNKKSLWKKPFSARLAVASALVIVLTGAFLLPFPAKARALGEKILVTVETLLGGTQMNVKIGYKHDEPGKTPPPESFRDVPVSHERIVSLEEAGAASPFPVAIPQDIPAGYKLEQVKFQEMVKGTARVTMHYNGPAPYYFQISEINAPDGYAGGYGYDVEDADARDIKIGEGIGKMITFKNEKLRIMWLKQDMVYELEGRIPQEEALKTVRSMR